MSAPERKREAGMPVGLKNVGNTCYFNSLIQTYFNIPGFVELIMKLDIKDLLPTDLAQPVDKDAKPVEKFNKSELIINMKELFTRLIKSNSKYQDASQVLRVARDEFGRGLEIGEQRDVSECHLFILNALLNDMKPQDTKEEKVEEMKEPSVPESTTEKAQESSLVPTKDAEMTIEGADQSIVL